MFKDFKNKFFKLKNIKIFYKIGGKGKPILLLHGYPQTHFMWSKIADQLAKKFTNKIKNKYNLEVINVDERFSSKEAKQRIIEDGL